MRVQNYQTAFVWPLLFVWLGGISSPVHAYHVENAEYYEQVWGQADYGWYLGEGEDDSKPETVEHTYNYVDPLYGAEFVFNSRGQTLSKGPGAESKVDGVSNAPPEVGWAETRSIAQATVLYEAAVYNSFGTHDIASVPVIVEVVAYTEANTTGVAYAATYSWVQAYRFDVDPLNGVYFREEVEACMGKSYTKSCVNGDDPGPNFIHQVWSIELPVGPYQGDRNFFWVSLDTGARVDLGASLYYDPEPGYVPYSGTGLGLAFADPIISIDPEWEHADKFELILSPGVVQAIREFPTKPSVPPMPWLHLLLD